jgi:hypothetical protein
MTPSRTSSLPQGCSSGELGVTLCHWNTQIEQTVAGSFALAAGWAFMPGLARLTAEVDSECA